VARRTREAQYPIHRLSSRQNLAVMNHMQHKTLEAETFVVLMK
jgi:hypothetical protein